MPPPSEDEADDMPSEYENFIAYNKRYGSPDIPMDTDDPGPVSQETLERKRGGSPSGDVAEKTGLFDGDMLLAKPTFAFRNQEPGRDFNYGPATAISAANFTRSSHRPAPIQQYKDQKAEKPLAQKSQAALSKSKTNHSPHAGNPEISVDRSRVEDGQVVPSLNVQKSVSPPQTVQPQVDDIGGDRPELTNETSIPATKPPFRDPSPVFFAQPSDQHRAEEVPFRPPNPLRDQPRHVQHHSLEMDARYPQPSTRKHQHETRDQNHHHGGNHGVLPPFADEEHQVNRPREGQVGKKSVPGLRASRHAPFKGTNTSQEQLAPRPTHTRAPEHARFNDSNTSQEQPAPHPAHTRVLGHAPFNGTKTSQEQPAQHPTHTRVPSRSTDTPSHPKTIFVKHAPRPPSRSSNVSRRRVIPHKSHVSHISELPSDARSESLAPSTEARENAMAINHDFTSNMANVINNYTQHHRSVIDKQMAKYDRYIKRLKFERAEGKKELVKCASQIQSQDHTIQEFQKKEASMADQIKKLEREAALSEARVQKIEDKYRMCKGYLNSALEEQQELYSQSKKRCEESIEEIRAMEKKHAASLELAVQNAETARAQMMDKVKHVVSQTKIEGESLRRELQFSQQQLRTKTNELEREQDSNRLLSEALKSMKVEKDGLDNLMAQNKEILERLDEQHTAEIQKTKQVEEETQSKFVEVNEGIKGLLKLVSAQPIELINIEHSHRQLADCITAKANDMALSQNASEESTRKFFTDIENLVKQVLEHLNQQNQNTSQELAKMTEEYGGLLQLVRLQETRSQELEAEIDAMKEEAERGEAEVRRLDEKLFHYENVEEELKKAHQDLLSVQAEKERLEDEVKAKDTQIKSLEDTTTQKNRDQTSEIFRMTADVTKLNQMLRDKEESSRVAVDKAAELARSEMRIEMEKADAEAKKIIYLTEKQRDVLAADVEKLKHDLQSKEAKSDQDAQTIDSLRNSLSAAESRMENLTEEIKQSGTNLEELRTQEAEKIKALEERITCMEKTSAERLEDTRHVKAAIQQLVSALEDSAGWNLLTSETKSGILSDFDKMDSPSDAGNVTTIAQILQRIAAAIQHHRPAAPIPQMLTQDDASSRFFQKQPSILPELRSSEQSGIGGRIDMRLRPRDEERSGSGHDTNGQNLGLTHIIIDNRRVEVRSPALGLQEEPSPPSIAEEKVMRREAQQPRPIMKKTAQRNDRANVAVSNVEAFNGVFARNMDQEDSQVPPSGQPEGHWTMSEPREFANPGGKQKGKKAASNANTRAAQKQQMSTVPSKRKRLPDAPLSDGPASRPVRITRHSLTQESQLSLQSQALSVRNGMETPLSIDQGLSPPDSQQLSQSSSARGLASQPHEMARATRTYGHGSQTQGSSQSQLRNDRKVSEDDTALLDTRQDRKKRSRTGRQELASEMPGPVLIFPNLQGNKTTT